MIPFRGYCFAVFTSPIAFRGYCLRVYCFRDYHLEALMRIQYKLRFIISAFPYFFIYRFRFSEPRWYGSPPSPDSHMAPESDSEDC
jgi:hypothetical protein